MERDIVSGKIAVSFLKKAHVRKVAEARASSPPVEEEEEEEEEEGEGEEEDEPVYSLLQKARAFVLSHSDRAGALEELDLVASDLDVSEGSDAEEGDELSEDYRFRELRLCDERGIRARRAGVDVEALEVPMRIATPFAEDGEEEGGGGMEVDLPSPMSLVSSVGGWLAGSSRI